MTIVSDIALFLQQTPLLVDVVFWLTLMLVLGTVFILFYVFIKRVRNDYDLRYEKLFKDRWRPILFRYLDNEEIETPQLSQQNRILLMRLWLNIRNQLSDDAFPRLNEFAWHAGFDKTIKEILQYKTAEAEQKKIRLQLLAIHVARALNSPLLREELVEASESSNFRVNVAATAALVAIDDKAADIAIITTLLKFRQWSPFVISKLSKVGGGKILHLVADQLDELPAEQSRNLFGLVEQTDDKTLLPLILERLDKTDDLEEKAIAIRALARIGGVYYKNIIKPYCKSDEEFLRINAAASFKLIGEQGDLPELITLLSDSNWWVRYRAAQAILTIYDTIHANTNNLLTQIEDSFGRDMVKQVCAEKAL